MKNVYIARKYNEKKMIITHTHQEIFVRSLTHTYTQIKLITQLDKISQQERANCVKEIKQKKKQIDSRLFDQRET